MNIIQSSYKKIVNLFVSFFKVINENSQVNILHSISKDRDGNTMIFISSLNAAEPYPIYPHHVIHNPYLKNQFRKSDIRIIEGIIISEGDIFISEKEYQGNSSCIALHSVINDEKWRLSEDQIMGNPLILNRINKRFFEDNKVLKHVFSQ